MSYRDYITDKVYTDVDIANMICPECRKKFLIGSGIGDDGEDVYYCRHCKVAIHEII